MVTGSGTTHRPTVEVGPEVAAMNRSGDTTQGTTNLMKDLKTNPYTTDKSVKSQDTAITMEIDTKIDIKTDFQIDT